MTFANILLIEKERAVSRLFKRAQMASWLRHSIKRTNRHSARALSDIKMAALCQAIKIAPDLVRVGMCECEHLRLVQYGKQSLHVPSKQAGLGTVFTGNTAA